MCSICPEIIQRSNSALSFSLYLNIRLIFLTKLCVKRLYVKIMSRCYYPIIMSVHCISKLCLITNLIKKSKNSANFETGDPSLAKFTDKKLHQLRIHTTRACLDNLYIYNIFMSTLISSLSL